MRRDVRRHPDGDAGGAVDEQVRELGRQHDRLAAVAGVVVPELDRLLVQLAEQGGRGAGELGLGVAVRRRRVAVHRAEVPLAVDQGHPHDPVLRQPDHRLVDGAVAVRVVAAHHVADDLGGLGRLAVEREVRVVVHGVEDAPLDRLEPVADVRQGAAGDHRHRVPDEPAAGLGRDRHRLDRFGHHSPRSLVRREGRSLPLSIGGVKPTRRCGGLPIVNA